MEYQYSSICRGEHSIMGAIKKAGVPDPAQYIRFFNLRNYDRINANATMVSIEQESGVQYADARKEHDDIVGAGYDGDGEGTGATWGQRNQKLEDYKAAGSKRDDTTNDTISGCYMADGQPISSIPWDGSEEDEINAFVSEELYIHSKILIADDRIVICGSANMNDRSQLGTHDSEIAVVIEDSDTVDSVMGGQQFQAAKFAASLRRQIFRKHLGLLPFQDWTKPDANFLPVDQGLNAYDWGSQNDLLVQDVLSPDFTQLWENTAKINTDVFAKAFHCVPADNVKNWKEYDDFFAKYFVSPDKDGRYTEEPSKYNYGHVVREEFPGGVGELKQWLDRVKGTLVEMPLDFMSEVDFASGLSLNALTEEIYT
jgi:phospholipase D1/2